MKKILSVLALIVIMSVAGYAANTFQQAVIINNSFLASSETITGNTTLGATAISNAIKAATVVCTGAM